VIARPRGAAAAFTAEFVLSCAAFFLIPLFIVPVLAGSLESEPDLTIYTYDTFAAQGGLGPEVLPLFEKKCACRVRAVAAGDAGQLLTRIQLDAERRDIRAQLVIGIDQQIWSRAKPWLEPWGKWVPRGYAAIPEKLRVENGFLPIDYGVMTLMADMKQFREMQVEPPRSLRDLINPAFKRNILLQDPRTSAPGLGFLLFAKAVLGKDSVEFWKSLRKQWLTLTPGWDGAYALFLKGEAPLVWSYTTSQAYHEEHGDSGDIKGRRYRALLFREGQPYQIEGAAIVRNSIRSERQRGIARAFLEFLISREVQARVPLKNWMLPVLSSVTIPESFKRLPEVKKLVQTPVDPVEIKEVLSEWGRVISTGQWSTGGTR